MNYDPFDFQDQAELHAIRQRQELINQNNARNGKSKKSLTAEGEFIFWIVAIFAAGLAITTTFMISTCAHNRENEVDRKSPIVIQSELLLHEINLAAYPKPTVDNNLSVAPLPSKRNPQEQPKISSSKAPFVVPDILPDSPVVITSGSIVYLKNELKFTDDEGLFKFGAKTKLTVIEVLGDDKLRVNYQANPYRSKIFTVMRDNVDSEL